MDPKTLSGNLSMIKKGALNIFKVAPLPLNTTHYSDQYRTSSCKMIGRLKGLNLKSWPKNQVEARSKSFYSVDSFPEW